MKTHLSAMWTLIFRERTVPKIHYPFNTRIQYWGQIPLYLSCRRQSVRPGEVSVFDKSWAEKLLQLVSYNSYKRASSAP